MIQTKVHYLNYPTNFMAHLSRKSPQIEMIQQKSYEIMVLKNFLQASCSKKSKVVTTINENFPKILQSLIPKNES